MINPEIKFKVDTSLSNEVTVTLEQHDRPKVSVVDFDPEGSSFLDSHGYTHLGFYMTLGSPKGEPVMEDLEGQTTQDIKQTVLRLGSFSVLTAAQPATETPKRFRDRNDIHMLEAIAMDGTQPYILSRVLSSGQQLVDTASFNVIDFTPRRVFGLDEDIVTRQPLSKDFIQSGEWECLQTVHDDLAEQALKEILKPAELATI